MHYANYRFSGIAYWITLPNQILSFSQQFQSLSLLIDFALWYFDRSFKFLAFDLIWEAGNIVKIDYHSGMGSGSFWEVMFFIKIRPLKSWWSFDKVRCMWILSFREFSVSDHVWPKASLLNFRNSTPATYSRLKDVGIFINPYQPVLYRPEC